MNKFVLPMTAALASFFAPLTTAFIVAISAVALDTFTKIIVVVKLQGVKNIVSRKLFRVVPKTLFYFVFIIMAHILATFIDPTIPFVKLVLVTVVGIEAYSIDENFEQMTGFSFIKKLITFVKNLTQYKNDTKNEFT